MIFIFIFENFHPIINIEIMNKNKIFSFISRYQTFICLKRVKHIWDNEIIITPFIYISTKFFIKFRN